MLPVGDIFIYTVHSQQHLRMRTSESKQIFVHLSPVETYTAQQSRNYMMAFSIQIAIAIFCSVVLVNSEDAFRFSQRPMGLVSESNQKPGKLKFYEYVQNFRSRIHTIDETSL